MKNKNMNTCNEPTLNPVRPSALLFRISGKCRASEPVFFRNRTGSAQNAYRRKEVKYHGR